MLGEVKSDVLGASDRFDCLGKSSGVELGDGLGVCELLSSVLISMLSDDHLSGSFLVVDCSGVDHWCPSSVC